MEDGINTQIKEDKEQPQEEEKHEESQTSSGWGGWGFSAFSVLSDLQKKAEEISRNVSLLFFITQSFSPLSICFLFGLMKSGFGFICFLWCQIWFVMGKNGFFSLE